MPDIRSEVSAMRKGSVEENDDARLSLPTLPDAQALLKVLEQFEAYRKALKKQPLSPHTRRAYETRLQHFLGFLGSRLEEYPEALTNNHARDYVARDYKQYLKVSIKSSPQTVNAYLTAIDSFYTFLGLGKAKATREELPNLAPQALTAKEHKEFLRAVERCKRPRDRAIATLLLNTALRISECKDLNLDDVLFTERKGLLKIRNGKGAAYREVPLNSASRCALQEWLIERKSKFPKSRDDAFFLSNRGSRLSTDGIDHTVRRIAESAGLQGVSSHTLRHTCLTNLIRHGADVVLVAQIGGHKKLETTMRYSLATHSDREEALEQLPSNRIGGQC
ncbi:MAG: integrase [Cyanobacteria bacterium DS2.3.42]|nr:integrase [Cyanobacteria bacterium DS2.3.42]